MMEGVYWVVQGLNRLPWLGYSHLCLLLRSECSIMLLVNSPNVKRLSCRRWQMRKLSCRHIYLRWERASKLKHHVIRLLLIVDSGYKTLWMLRSNKIWLWIVILIVSEDWLYLWSKLIQEVALGGRCSRLVKVLKIWSMVDGRRLVEGIRCMVPLLRH
jgi:hypothetical protein